MRHPVFSECPRCRQPVEKHSHSIIIQEGSSRALFHQTCYRRHRKEQAKAQRRLTQELRRANGAARRAAAVVPPPSVPKPAPKPVVPEPETVTVIEPVPVAATRRVPDDLRPRRAVPCPVCGLGRSAVFYGSPTGHHIRRCLAGHHVYWINQRPLLLTAEQAQTVKAAYPHGKRTGELDCPLCRKRIPFKELGIHVGEDHA